MEEELKKYRTYLVELESKLKESYDKLVVLLSGGALGLSMTFLSDIVNLNDIVYPMALLSAWGAFILSLMAILGALSFGIEAHRRAVTQVDAGTIYQQKAGGWFSRLTKMLHRSAAIFLFIGLVSMSVFVYLNVGENNARGKTAPKATTQTGTPASATAAETDQPTREAHMGSTTPTPTASKPK